MTGKSYRVEITVDPPRGIVPDEEAAYIHIDAECSSRETLEWFLKNYEKNLPDMAYHYGIEEVEGD